MTEETVALIPDTNTAPLPIEEAEPENESSTVEISVDDALAKLREMTARRDQLTEAITKYKKYVQKLVGRL